MAFFYLNKINSSISKKDLEREFIKFGQLKFVGNMKDDIRNQGFLSTIAEFIKLDDEDGFLNSCKSKKILAMKRKEDLNKQNFSAPKQNIEKVVQENKTSEIFNPSFHFYKDKAYGKGIENFVLTQNFNNFFEIPNSQTFTLETIYPGLLIGSGYNHPKLKDTNDDFQLGFFFDHTTGLPIISGSSIKGMLRSVCEKNDFMQEVYGKKIPIDVFEEGKIIFYDAFIVSTQNKNNRIFGTDYITSHFSSEENGMFKEPNPIKFLKVLSGVTFKFQFQFINEEYINIFKQIILDFGLGAKTNVGYGKFQE